MADLDRLYHTLSKVKGRIDIIFANAGVGEFVPFPKVSEEHFDRQFRRERKRRIIHGAKGITALE